MAEELAHADVAHLGIREFGEPPRQRVVEAERTALDDPLSRWLPELADAEGGDVSVREPLGHQGGVIRDRAVADFWQRGLPFPARADLLPSAATEGPVLAQNEHFNYSTLGHTI
ncbi:beta-lactamase family protein, partial [Microbacterium testaceum]|uniref:beta-lactamase family protein n=1 Tax=Microbacterium testaceum TaxID=2033 RepID=UPI001F4C7DC4